MLRTLQWTERQSINKFKGSLLRANECISPLRQRAPRMLDGEFPWQSLGFIRQNQFRPMWYCIRARSFLHCGAAAFEDEANLVAQAQAVVDAAEEAEVQKDPGFLRKATTRGVFVQNSEIQSRLMYKDVHTCKCIVTYRIAHNL